MFVSERRRLQQGLKEEGRLPPGQSLTLKFPVLHYGGVPRADLKAWTLSAFGLVEEEQVWNWEEFIQLPTRQVTCDIHCVTRWSKFDTTWEGVSFRTLVELMRVKKEQRYR